MNILMKLEIPTSYTENVAVTAVPVERHGRLIDADVLEEELGELYEQYRAMGGMCDARDVAKTMHGIYLALQAVFDAPTVVESDWPCE